MAKKKTQQSVSTAAYQQILQGQMTPGQLPEGTAQQPSRQRFGASANMNPYTAQQQAPIKAGPGPNDVRTVTNEPGRSQATYSPYVAVWNYSYRTPEPRPTPPKEIPGKHGPGGIVNMSLPKDQNPKGQAMFGALSGMAGKTGAFAAMTPQAQQLQAMQKQQMAQAAAKGQQVPQQGRMGLLQRLLARRRGR